MPDETFLARLFHSSQPARDLALDSLVDLDPSDDEVLWIDLQSPTAEALDTIWKVRSLPDAARAFLESGSTSPEVGQNTDYFWVRCVVAGESVEGDMLAGTVLVCVAGPNEVLSIHEAPIGFIGDLRDEQSKRAPIGNLSSESFVAILLDRQLATYFKVVSDYECAIERIEVDILRSRASCSLAELRRLRRWASRMRRMLAPHRAVFGEMSRPDFRPSESRDAAKHFVALDTRFERAMDLVENARELVLGSFDLFSSQTALRTNETMRVLTFVTVITGLLATIVGALGMNFDAGFFKSQDAGFWWAVGGLVFVTALALALGRWRRWF